MSDGNGVRKQPLISFRVIAKSRSGLERVVGIIDVGGEISGINHRLSCFASQLIAYLLSRGKFGCTGRQY